MVSQSAVDSLRDLRGRVVEEEEDESLRVR